MIGLKRGSVKLHPHNENWHTEAAATIDRLKRVLGDRVRDAEHVGSTSIHSISAKPIIDIALAVNNFEDVIECADLLAKSGFHYRKNASDENQLLLASGSFYEGCGEEQTHFIHVVLTDSEEWWGYIYFRDYLRIFDSVAHKYEEIKRALMYSSKTRAEYTEGKDEFITEVRSRAMALSLIGKVVSVNIDRQKGSLHPDYNTVYPINYGYIEGTTAADKEPLDAYVLGIYEPLASYTGKVIGVVHRNNDTEDKLLVAPISITVTAEQAMSEISFIEQYFESEIYIT